MSEDRESILISRVIDREETGEDWIALERLAASDPGLWSRLIDGLREDAFLEQALEAKIGEPVSLGAAAARRPRSWRRGIAAALVVVAIGAAYLTGRFGTPAENRPQQRPVSAKVENPVHAEPAATDADLIRTLSPVVLDQHPAANGNGYELIYLDRVIRRRFVEKAYRLVRDEHGNITAQLASPEAMRSVRQF